MKKYILFILGAAFLLATILFGVYFQGHTLLSKSIQVKENTNSSVTEKDSQVTEMYGMGPTSYHQLGKVHEATRSWSSDTQDGRGFLTYGPYQRFKKGFYIAVFELQIDNTTLDTEEEIMRIDIFNPFKKEKLAEKKIYRKDFQKSMQKQNFILPFEITETQAIEYRVYVLGKSYVEHFKTTILRDNRVVFLGNDIGVTHEIGRESESAWQAEEVSGYMTRGPYLQHLPADIHTASFQLSIGENTGENDIVTELQVFDMNKQELLQKRIIKRGHFYAQNTPQDFDIEFEIDKKTLLEFRVLVYGKANITHHKTQIYSDQVTMNDLWDKKAYFDFYDKKLFTSSLETFPELLVPKEASTAPIVTLDGVWYTLNRQRVKEKFNGCTKNQFTFRTVIRKSTDKGKTWSKPVLIDPVTGPTDGMCNNTDGSLFFDQETGVWHFITQCVPKEGGWGLCHYMRDNISPMGLFKPSSENPVVKGGELFQQLCREMGDKCPELIKINPKNSGKPWENVLGMIDEGTPQITEKRDGYFYVTFHGAHYQTPAPSHITWGARAVAKTKDFINWEITGEGLPNDIMLSNKDCASWNPDGQIGAGVQIRSGGYNYVLFECPEKTIAITGNYQEWAYGLNRHPNYGKTGTWENYSDNPLVKNSDPLTEARIARLQYGKLFRDRGNIYMATLVKGIPGPAGALYGMPLYIYKLSGGANGPRNYGVPGTIDILSGDTTNLVQN